MIVSSTDILIVGGISAYHGNIHLIYFGFTYQCFCPSRNSLIYGDIKIKHSTLEAAQKRIEALTKKLK